MLWFYFAILSVIGSAVANIFRRVIMKDDRSDPYTFSIVFQLLAAGIVGIFALVHGFRFPPIAQYPLNFALQAALWSSATLVQFKASQYLEASEATIIETFSSIITIATASFLLQEHFTISYAIGTALIIFSVVYISYKKNNMKLNKGVVFALLYCLFAGVASTNDAYLLHRIDALSYLTIGFFNPGLLLLIIKPRTLKKMQFLFQLGESRKIGLLTLFYALSAIAFFYAITAGGQVSQVSPINQASIIFTVFFAAVFLHERDHLLKKVFCTVLVTIGVLLLR